MSRSFCKKPYVVMYRKIKNFLTPGLSSILLCFVYLQRMHAHAQFCMSGDNTLEAAKFSIEDITNKEGDEYFVIVLSDANLDRYAISPARFSQILNSDEQVNAYAIFIGSLGDQAER